ncbi:MAG: tetraacyldisaccharide 4'-kinase [Oligoflexales bacterium]|nr:tetraacyldisaccharide 4'-kinase [Oligoflexales bacterium]
MAFDFKNNYSSWLHTKVDKQNTLLFYVLYPLSLLYLYVISFKNFAFKLRLFRPKSLNGFVISVGNISIGGAGKTPFTLFLLEELLKHAARPVVLTRGYGAGLNANDFLILVNGSIFKSNISSESMNLDEPTLISRNFPTVPVVVAAKRFIAADHFLKLYKNYNPTHWILEDGFQHRKIARNFDIVLIDGLRDLKHEVCLPAGLLREPLNNLSRTDVIVFIKTINENQKDTLRKEYVKYSQNILFADFRFSVLLEVKKGKLVPIDTIPKSAMLLSAIAQPNHFAYMVRDSLRDIDIIEEVYEPDHSLFSFKNHGAVLSKGITVITTEKDYWRQPEFFSELVEQAQIRVLIFKIKVELDGLDSKNIGC